VCRCLCLHKPTLNLVCGDTNQGEEETSPHIPNFNPRCWSKSIALPNFCKAMYMDLVYWKQAQNHQSKNPNTQYPNPHSKTYFSNFSCTCSRLLIDPTTVTMSLIRNRVYPCVMMVCPPRMIDSIITSPGKRRSRSGRP
jgi:hypothetical protein